MGRPKQRDPSLTDSYTVAWICALEEEYFCACRMLDEEFNGLEISEDNDDNTYLVSMARIQRARVARDMVRTFPHLRFALMVGIGGGAPSPRNDIRLGDIVLKDGRFQKTGQLNTPPEKLLGAIPEMRRLYRDKKKPDRLAEHLRLLDDMEDYQKPAVDWLYAADYSHVDGPNRDRCDVRATVVRPERQNYRTLHVHYGNVASGNSVLKDAKMRDVYAQDPELNILCFEMEAAGPMNNIPCLVIRRICDYCDSHKNDEWHKYAALAAAAYARELLLVLQPQRVDAMPPWAERVAQELEQVLAVTRRVKNGVDRS
ncbi:nucleoside phosphorylase domain-containing protein [Aspergillus alliaceus]|uniref:Nucleoside phosphorylase domain-containing protein n=1 Tax=Petromyces alliaceus TaxID=209559 RepID=A0A5N7BW33_PETAA|nr:nucleoside phosphorylase domain-containing protein [Aspergillus alliaceus]